LAFNHARTGDHGERQPSADFDLSDFHEFGCHENTKKNS